MIALASGRLTARILPEVGGIVAAFAMAGPRGPVPVLHAPPGAAPSRAAPNFMGSWAMLPFANRAFDNVVDDGEQRFAVPANHESGSIHGFGWHSAWEVLRYDRTSMTMAHRRDSGPDPYRYRATQEIALDEEGMTIAIAVTSEADRPLPFGIGHHPWFPCAPDTRLRLSARAALSFGAGFRATGSTALADGGPYAGGPLFRQPGETAWSFLGWDGQAVIETPSSGLAIRLTAGESLRCPVVWAPAGADFLCVEPQSHAIGSPSEPAARAAAPLTRLAPGETLSGWLRIAPALLA